MESQYLHDAAGNPTGPTLQQAVFAGQVDPGNLVIVREIKNNAGPADIDTSNYEARARSTRSPRTPTGRSPSATP